MSKLDEAVSESIAKATAAFVVSSDKVKIKEATTVLRAVLTEWQAKACSVQQAIAGLLDVIRRSCDHAGAQRGCNERDGSWMNACPHCGESR